MKDRIKIKGFTRVEGGTIQNAEFEFYEDQLASASFIVEKKEVFSKLMNRKITTRVTRMGKVWVHALFFENGNIYDLSPMGFKLREIRKEVVI